MLRPLRPSEAETVVRGSRFLARLEAVTDEESAAAAVAAVEERHPDATHHCWAYRVWREGRVRAAGFDAGEPSGTAGRPILGALERADLVQAVSVVARWFGGTKLGTGGLTRAYAESARAVVEAAMERGGVEEVVVRAGLRVEFDYGATASVRRAAARHAAREEGAEYGARTSLVLSVPVPRVEALAAELGEATAGRASIERLADRLGAPAAGEAGGGARPGA